MTGPVAMTVHPGGGAPPAWRAELIGEWLTANGINPTHVHAGAPISIFTVPYTPPDAAAGEGPWFIKVIVFTQVYVNDGGAAEYDFLKYEPVRFQRTVPMQTPFPADPTPGSEGSPHGQEPQVQPVQEGQRPPQHQERAEEDEQQAVRLAEGQEVSRGRSCSREERPGQGVAAWVASAEEGGSTSRRGQVSEPEEVRQGTQEEVGGA